MDSASLCLVSLNAYHRISKDSFFRRILRKEDLGHAKNSLVFHGFSKLLGFARESKEYFIVLKLIEQNIDDICEMVYGGDAGDLREKFEKLKASTGKEILERFEKHFKEEKKKI